VAPVTVPRRTVSNGYLFRVLFPLLLNTLPQPSQPQSITCLFPVPPWGYSAGRRKGFGLLLRLLIPQPPSFAPGSTYTWHSLPIAPQSSPTSRQLYPRCSTSPVRPQPLQQHLPAAAAAGIHLISLRVKCSRSEAWHSRLRRSAPSP